MLLTQSTRRRGPSLFVALGAFFLANAFLACQDPGMNDAGGSGKPVAQSSTVKPAGDQFLFEAATCKDKGPADFGLAFRCTDESDPVCGCDGKTYVNTCQAWGVGQVNVAHKGACGATAPVVPAVPDPIPPTDTVRCGTPDPILPDPIPANPDGPTCKDPVPDMSAVRCSDILQPVCGCDGKTYPNTCIAHVSGSNVAYQGECKPK